MTITGKVIGFENGFHSIETIRNKSVQKVKLPSMFEKGRYLSLELNDDVAVSVSELSVYKTLPFKEIINSQDHEDYEIEFIKPFKISDCLNQEEAEFEFSELLKNSSCNFVQNLSYIENEKDHTYEVSGEIGLYSLVHIAEPTLSSKFSNEFENNVKLVSQNLQDELEKIMNQEALKAMCKNVSIWLVSIMLIMVIIQGLHKYF